jgi:hypothetical protein
MTDTLSIVQATVAEMMEKMGFPGEIAVTSPSERSYSVKVTVADGSKLLIGQHGVALSALQYMVRSLLTRKLKERIDVLVDVNGSIQVQISVAFFSLQPLCSMQPLINFSRCAAISFGIFLPTALRNLSTSPHE